RQQRPVAKLVAVLVNLALAIVLGHGGVPAVRVGREPAELVVGAVGQQLGALALPASPAVAAHQLVELGIVALVAGVLGVPALDGLGNLIHRSNLTLARFGEDRDQRAIVHVPAAVVEDFGHTVIVQDAAARLPAIDAIERLDQRRAAAAHAV